MNQASVLLSSSSRPIGATSLTGFPARLGRFDPQGEKAERWNRWLVAATFMRIAALPNVFAATAPVSETLVQRSMRG